MIVLWGRGNVPTGRSTWMLGFSLCIVVVGLLCIRRCCAFEAKQPQFRQDGGPRLRRPERCKRRRRAERPGRASAAAPLLLASSAPDGHATLTAAEAAEAIDARVASADEPWGLVCRDNESKQMQGFCMLGTFASWDKTLRWA